MTVGDLKADWAVLLLAIPVASLAGYLAAAFQTTYLVAEPNGTAPYLVLRHRSEDAYVCAEFDERAETLGPTYWTCALGDGTRLRLWTPGVRLDRSAD